MAVRNGEDFQDALQGAILTRPAVQHVEGDVRLDGGKHRGDVASNIDPGYAVIEPQKRLCASLTGSQRHIAFGRPASHQNGDMLAHAAWAATLIRLCQIESRMAAASRVSVTCRG